MKKILTLTAAVMLAVSMNGTAVKADDASAIMADRDEKMYRLYNPNTGEHFYTSDDEEKENVIAEGWNDEGIGWYAPLSSNTPVYRLYNPNAGEHHYTMSEEERDALKEAGWNDEGIGWYSDDEETIPVYREYNPNAFANNHNYSTSTEEKEDLLEQGWNDEGIGWYGVDDAVVNSTQAKMVAYAETFLGTPYQWGGSSPETGFDCSGFVDYIFYQTGLDETFLQSRFSTYDMSSYLNNQIENPTHGIVWSTLDTDDMDQIQAGDIVLCAESKEDAEENNFPHVGIGVDKNSIISAMDEGVCIYAPYAGYSPAGYIRIYRMMNQ